MNVGDSMDILTTLILHVHEQIYSTFLSPLQFFHQCFIVFIVEISPSLLNLFLGTLFLFFFFVIALLISISDNPLLAYYNATDSVYHLYILQFLLKVIFWF
jgi:hypothetical protein